MTNKIICADYEKLKPGDIVRTKNILVDGVTTWLVTWKKTESDKRKYSDYNMYSLDSGSYYQHTPFDTIEELYENLEKRYSKDDNSFEVHRKVTITIK